MIDQCAQAFKCTDAEIALAASERLGFEAAILTRIGTNE
jgi:hypothetical protein